MIRLDGGIFLPAEEAAVEDFYEQILRTKIHLPASQVDLHRFVITVIDENIGGPITCDINMVGVLNGSAEASDANGRIIYAY